MADFFSSVSLALLGFALLLVSLIVYAKSSDPYNLFHLSLNRLPEEDKTAAPKTEWLNMGLWKDTRVFPQACEALAKRLVNAAELKIGERVLDVGHGTGESLIVLLTDPTIPRPKSLTGITSLATHHQRSVARVERLGLAGQTTTSLYHGDAVYTSKEKQDHPLHPDNTSQFDVVFALDCAYHFHTREKFLRQAHQHCAPGGRVALADICFKSNALKRPSLTRSILKLMPKENMISVEEYVEVMEKIGYTEVKLEDISNDVFPGFIGFLKTQGIGWNFFARVLGLYVRKGGARFVIVTGRRSETK
ncbi:hypothetical protein AAF712_000959 [Marasmius tenuissimus]|uniref:phosphoethanolamine N-methyltransferase n=1 Tax=Marasmius tenuissimus TaxID=585030 RepID=A0ABR3ADM5_9AGAR